MSGEKSEPPTSKRLRDARKKGQVAFSKELVSSALMLAFFVLFIASLPSMLQRFRLMVTKPAAVLDQDFAHAAESLMRSYAQDMMTMLAPFFGVAIVVTVVACVGQFGFLLSGEAAKPSLGKLNPLEYFKKTFGLQNLIEFLKSNLKIVVLGLLLFFLIRGGLQAMVLAPTCGIDCLQAVLGKLLMNVAIWSAGPFIVIAAADFAFQKWNFLKKNRMSKDEVKREYKESEGDPQIKGMRKQLHQQMLAEGAVDRARTATVLVTNPTHVAVAIQYDKDTTPLPVVTAIGTDILAKRMIAAAQEAGVPVMQNIPLARSLLETGTVDQYIPSDLIEPFAEVLRALQSLAR